MRHQDTRDAESHNCERKCPNLIYSVLPFESMETTFATIIERLSQHRTDMPRTIIYCQSQDKCAQLYLLMKLLFYYESVKDSVLKAFTQTSSPLRIVIATIACHRHPWYTLCCALGTTRRHGAIRAGNRTSWQRWPCYIALQISGWFHGQILQKWR